MLKLFQSIFDSRNDPSPHTAELIERAIERTVDGTDRRLRAVPGYQKKLRPAVTHAIDHVVALVDGLAPALELSTESYGTNPEVTAYFASIEHLQEVLAHDATLDQWRGSGGGAAERVVLLLLMTREERRVLGVALEGETLRHGVAQTTVSLSKHRLLDPTAIEAETRRLLKRRAFDHLLALALGRIGQAVSERSELERERDLLRRKSAALAAGRWGFDQAGDEAPADPQALERQLEDIDLQLGALGSGPDLLAAQLERVMDVLMQAEHNFWLASEPLIVDRMGVKQARTRALAPEIHLPVLRNATGQSLIARMVTIDRAALPERRDLLREAERYLG